MDSQINDGIRILLPFLIFKSFNKYISEARPLIANLFFDFKYLFLKNIKKYLYNIF